MKVSRGLLTVLLVCSIAVLVAVPVSQSSDLQWGESYIEVAKDLLAKIFSPVQAIIDAIKSKLQAVVDKVHEVHTAMNSASDGCKTGHDVTVSADETVGAALQASSDILGHVVDLQTHFRTHLSVLQNTVQDRCRAIAPAALAADLQFFGIVQDIWNSLSTKVQEALKAFLKSVHDFLLGGLESMKKTLDVARRELYEARITAKVAMEKSELAKDIVAKVDAFGERIREAMGLAKPAPMPVEALQIGEGWFWASAAEKAKELVEACLKPVRDAFQSTRDKIDGAAQEADELHIASGFVQRKAKWGAGLVAKVQAATKDAIRSLVEWLDDRLPKEQQKIDALLQIHVAGKLAHRSTCFSGMADVEVGEGEEFFGETAEWIHQKVSEVAAGIMAPVRAKIAGMRDFLINLETQIETAKTALQTVDTGAGAAQTTVGGLQKVLNLVRSDSSLAEKDLDHVADPELSAAEYGSCVEQFHQCTIAAENGVRDEASSFDAQEKCNAAMKECQEKSKK